MGGEGRTGGGSIMRSRNGGVCALWWLVRARLPKVRERVRACPGERDPHREGEERQKAIKERRRKRKEGESLAECVTLAKPPPNIANLSPQSTPPARCIQSVLALDASLPREHLSSTHVSPML
ncbi:hypothetical protein AAG570_002499 [Ranatra chinensis]|uniref:Uncharacterized protein n=1 Tax=Ranatra chinensis TaxID=642074 RepID=A0ABD0YW57_9HEMI